MDSLGDFLAFLVERKLVAGHLRGVFHLIVGRKIVDPAGAVVTAGATWRELATLLKNQRLDTRLVTELGLDPATLSPRDRRRFWYSAIAAARPDSPEARADAEKLVKALKPLGYVVGPAPAESKPSLSSPPEPPAVAPPEPEAEPPAEKPKKKPRKP